MVKMENFNRFSHVNESVATNIIIHHPVAPVIYTQQQHKTYNILLYHTIYGILLLLYRIFTYLYFIQFFYFVVVVADINTFIV